MVSFRQKYRRAGEIIIVLNLTAATISTSCAQQNSKPLRMMHNFSPIVGIARVIDGDSIEIAGQTIRIEGIDAPEFKQTCERNGAAWACGVEAAAMLRSIIRERPVSCAPVGKDRYGRMLGRCNVGTDELNALMVRRGFALSFTKYSVRYAPEETAAKAERAGLWSGTFVEPWNWRKSKAGN